jgi:hypothetical protein
MTVTKKPLRSHAMPALLMCFAVFAGTGSDPSMAQTPVAVNHQMTSYTEEADSASVSYELTVENASDETLQGLELTLVPGAVPVDPNTTLSFGDVDPRAAATATLSITTPLLMGAEAMQSVSFDWIGRYGDGGANDVDFPVQSYPESEGVLQ